MLATAPRRSGDPPAEAASDGLEDRVRTLYTAYTASDLATVEAVYDPELRS